MSFSSWLYLCPEIHNDGSSESAFPKMRDRMTLTTTALRTPLSPQEMYPHLQQQPEDTATLCLFSQTLLNQDKGKDGAVSRSCSSSTTKMAIDEDSSLKKH